MQHQKKTSKHSFNDKQNKTKHVACTAEKKMAERADEETDEVINCTLLIIEKEKKSINIC